MLRPVGARNSLSRGLLEAGRPGLDYESPALQDRLGSAQSCLWEEGGTFIFRSPKTWETEPSSEDRTPYTSAEWPGPTTSSACSGSHAALLDGFARKTVLHRRWRSGISPSHACLPSHLPSLLREPLLSLLHFYPRAWSESTLGIWVGGMTQSHHGLQTLVGPLRATEASRLGRAPTITS